MHYTYRFALYGLSGSGKTCVIAAMAMSHRDQPNGVTCTFLDDLDALNASDSPQQKTERELGLTRVQDAKRAIESGSVPPPTAAETMILTYLFTEPGRGEYRVELIDYPGELLRLRGGELANQLFQQLTKMDGILILAEMPDAREDNEAIYKQLEHLQSAITKLQTKMAGRNDAAPVVLLINKWDRYSTLNYQDPAEEEHELDDYLNQEPTPPHKNLLRILENALGKQNVKILPMSAFGEARVDSETGKEIPVNRRPLQSFNLLEGFRWLAERHDQLNLERLEARIQEDNWWRFGFGTTEQEKWYRRWIQLDSIASADALARNYSHEAAPKRLKHVRKLRRKALNKQWGRIAGAAITVFIFIPFVTLGAVDSNYRSTLENSAVKPDAKPEDQLKYQNWLSDYIESPIPSSYRLFFTKTAAKEELKVFRAKQEKNTCGAIDEYNESGQREELCLAASDCIALYPFGDYAVKAKTIRLECEVEDRRREEEKLALEKKEKEEESRRKEEALWSGIEAAGAGTSMRREKAGQYLEQFPAGNYASDAAKIVSDYENKQEWVSFSNACQDALRDNRFAEAAQMLAGREPETDQLTAIKQDFAQRLLDWVGREIDQAVSNEDWDQIQSTEKVIRHIPPVLISSAQSEAIKNIFSRGRQAKEQTEFQAFSDQISKYLEQGDFKQAADILSRQVPNLLISQYQARFPQIAFDKLKERLMQAKENSWNTGYVMLEDFGQIAFSDPKIRADLQQLKRQYSEEHDRELYDPCRRSPSLDNCKRYLSETRMKTMADAANRYVNYAGSQNVRQDFTLTLESIRSPTDYGDVQLAVDLDSLSFENLGDNGVLEVDEGRNTVGAKVSFTKKPTDRVTLSLEMTNRRIAWSDEPLGKKSENVSVDSLRDYQTCLPHPEKKEDPVCFHFSLAGLEEAPKMPVWGER